MDLENTGDRGLADHSPGFLIRRLNQIHNALFAEECGDLDATPVQFHVLQVIGEQPGLEQSKVAEEVGVDRATLAAVVARLERAGIVRRATAKHDRRLKLLNLTPRGRARLAKLTAPVHRAQERTLEPLSPEDQRRFAVLLERLVTDGNGHGRAKLRLRVRREED